MKRLTTTILLAGALALASTGCASVERRQAYMECLAEKYGKSLYAAETCESATKHLRRGLF